jgi:hypothetical protein
MIVEVRHYTEGRGSIVIRAVRRAGCCLVATVAAATLVAAAHGRQAASPSDFDFEFGEWDVRLSRLVDPLSGSTAWVEYEGTSIVRQIWNGRANLGELEVSGASGRVEGLSLRLYNPETRQWSIRWANSRDGELGAPMIGGFEDGVGRFHNQEMFGGRAIFVRFVFSDVTPDTFRLEQAFSADGGASWEPNWIAAFTRQ